MIEFEIDNFHEKAEDLTKILISRGAYNTKDIIKEVNVAMDAIRKEFKHISSIGENGHLEDIELVALRRYYFFVDCIIDLTKNYSHYMNDIIIDARKLAENIYGKFPE